MIARELFLIKNTCQGLHHSLLFVVPFSSQMRGKRRLFHSEFQSYRPNWLLVSDVTVSIKSLKQFSSKIISSFKPINYHKIIMVIIKERK